MFESNRERWKLFFLWKAFWKKKYLILSLKDKNPKERRSDRTIEPKGEQRVGSYCTVRTERHCSLCHSELQLQIQRASVMPWGGRVTRGQVMQVWFMVTSLYYVLSERSSSRNVFNSVINDILASLWRMIGGGRSGRSVKKLFQNSRRIMDGAWAIVGTLTVSWFEIYIRSWFFTLVSLLSGKEIFLLLVREQQQKWLWKERLGF